MSNFQNIISKILTESEFTTQLLADPSGTLKSNGVEPTPEMLAAVEGLDEAAVKRLAAALDGDLAAG